MVYRALVVTLSSGLNTGEFGEAETYMFMGIFDVRIKKIYVRIRPSNMEPMLLISLNNSYIYHVSHNTCVLCNPRNFVMRS